MREVAGVILGVCGITFMVCFTAFILLGMLKLAISIWRGGL